jgi:formylmethanofuran dehydrogenase subunit A
LTRFSLAEHQLTKAVNDSHFIIKYKQQLKKIESTRGKNRAKERKSTASGIMSTGYQYEELPSPTSFDYADSALEKRRIHSSSQYK